MTISRLLGAALFAASLPLSALAADSTSSRSMSSEAAGAMMMKPGEMMTMRPDGTMAMGMTPDAMMGADMMKMAKPMEGCVMVMMGQDGKMVMMDDMKMADGKMACDATATPPQ